MQLKPLPRQASWRHTGVRRGFEVLFTGPGPRGHRLRGVSTAVEDASAWSVDYSIDLDLAWHTQEVRAGVSTIDGERHTVLRRSADHGWEVDGLARADLTGCVDVDFESSGSVSPRFSRHRRSRALSSSPMIMRASDPPMK